MHLGAVALLVAKVEPFAAKTQSIVDEFVSMELSILARVEEPKPKELDAKDAIEELIPPAKPKARAKRPSRGGGSANAEASYHIGGIVDVRLGTGFGDEALQSEVDLPSKMKSSVIQPSLAPTDVAAFAHVGPLRSRIDDAQSRLDAYLYESANRNTTSSRREAPELASTGDGGLRYEGPRFQADIRPDGTVKFTDTPGVTLHGNPKSLLEWLKTPPPDLSDVLSSAPNINGNGNLPAINGQPPVPDALLMSFTFDSMDAIMRARGQDPYYAERSWFMRETKVEREKLFTQSAARARRAAAVKVVKRAKRLWLNRASASAGRRALFRLWDDCAEDEVGRVARERLLVVVRELTRELSYTKSELRSLNRQRESRERFSPYLGQSSQ